MKRIKTYGFFLTMSVLLLGLLLIDPVRGHHAAQLSFKSLLDMLLLLPPILVLVGLLDQWIKKDTLLKYMGPDAGFQGYLYVLLLAAIAAGPLYVAFPVAVLLLEKGASVRYVVFFLGAFTTVKLPVLLYEISSFGLVYTALHIGFGLLFFFMTAQLFERYQTALQMKTF